MRNGSSVLLPPRSSNRRRQADGRETTPQAPRRQHQAMPRSPMCRSLCTHRSRHLNRAGRPAPTASSPRAYRLSQREPWRRDPLPSGLSAPRWSPSTAARGQRLQSFRRIQQGRTHLPTTSHPHPASTTTEHHIRPSRPSRVLPPTSRPERPQDRVGPASGWQGQSQEANSERGDWSPYLHATAHHRNHKGSSRDVAGFVSRAPADREALVHPKCR